MIEDSEKKVKIKNEPVQDAHKPEVHAWEIEKVQLKKKIKPKKKVKGRVRKKTPKIKSRDIGVNITPPERECNDPNCPFHGTLSVRGIIIDGIVVSIKMGRTAVVQREKIRYVPKYERYEKRTSRYFAHWPPCIDLEEGDKVKIMECRPISKHTSFVVIGKV